MAGEVALIVGGGPGVSASCARLFAREGMQVAVAARNPDKAVLQALARENGTKLYGCDASDAQAVSRLFASVEDDLGQPKLVVHNIDGRERSPDIFRKSTTDADPGLVLDVIKNSAYSAFLVGQQAVRSMLPGGADNHGHRGTIIFTNASASFKGYPESAAFAIECRGKTGLAESLAREFMPQGIHVVNVPIDAAIGWTQENGTRAHPLAGTAIDDSMADPDRIAETYLQLHRQHRSTWAFEVVLRPWTEKC